MVLIVFLCLVLTVQGIILAIDDVFFKKPVQKPTLVKQEKEELSEEEAKLKKMREASREFLPDGTIHCLYYVPTAKKGRHVKKDEQTIEIYDVNANLLWEGINKKKPYEYLSCRVFSCCCS